ncbi:MAG: [FeFe] hydrogenase, group A [Syntrophomonas sp.]|uniref:[FeFe] hydrogenase, group A n=1 Tax=Syntrophomonas sp. TaxID=2053627 RepID=UPI002618E188|nr:[FeFe] hydrogenase, group A [Syntrophomonas sp.]MDD2510153.1 [FeFe] hydrogenase, group A [Syntrophomonas sp.]MDD3878925.1 [FeFe] hydrogenase, group A [Syntrophomonas sp.]MDD4625984.1 [FeFe] hydrogenase, group A [Syntrophomonas sp.]
MSTVLSDGVIHVSDDCKACDHCTFICPTGAISGVLGQKHHINPQKCINCGQCLINCPFNAIYDLSKVEELKKVLADSQKFVVVQEAPAVRVALGEEFGQAPGTNVKNKMYAALRKLGFDRVYDTEFTADLTIMEEGTELIHRVYGALGVAGFENVGPLPQFTSCCPAWIKYAEDNYPLVLPHISSAKSPQQMWGAVAKTYLAEKLNVNPANIFSVSVMPCTAKKYECERSEFIASGYQDVDLVITTRELAQMIKDAEIDFMGLADEEADRFVGLSTGAATIFGATGGVMEAALRTAYEILSGESLGKVEFDAVRGLDPVREATVEVPVKALGTSLPVSVCIVTGTKHVAEVIEDVLAGRSNYHFIEVMNCPGGCINGGGQPIRRDTY